MITQRMIGLVLLVVGVILFLVGLNASDSIADQISNMFTGKWTDNTAWYVYGGLGMALLGLLMSAVGGRGKIA